MELNVTDKEALRGSSPITGFDMDKITTTLKQFVRDWSEEGRAERDACYKPIIDEIKRLFPPSEDVKDITVLIPGAGLGRLMFEIARLGYHCQGNEWSLYMLFASHYVLNRSAGIHDSVIHPYVAQWCNVRTSADQVRPIRIPDIDPRDIKPGTQFSMAAGNFLEVYTEKDHWDCVATCFFIDTAHNVIEYIEHIFNILKPGGYWINLGPLLYHFSGMPNEMSIDLSYEDIKRIITKDFKFELLKEQTKVSSGYVENCQSMLKMNYESVFFVVRKPL
ncbi:carnosine N-methyltransferase-like [Actinia tenebrosa]|uniref:Carnosine N-methyltransferase n=1 Tax=Actinia tenebrosa TaxID=6105 RepID=A0A6P8J770_ACTTE|nr:carnosine N-methyltransferase-like [Actinia tenebrosa]